MNTETVESLSALSLRQFPQPKVERGFYTSEIYRIGVGESRFGTPMLVLAFRIAGSLRHGYLWRVPICTEDIHKLTQVHKAIGRPTPSLPRLLSGEDVLLPDHYLGAKALIHLKPEQYQGKWRSTITEVRPMDQAQAFRALVGEEPKL
jgi:hypothetical protein